MTEESTTPFMDVPQITKPADKQIKDLLETELNGKNLQQLEKVAQKRLLKKIIDIPPAAPDQLAKITGINPGTIRRIK